MLKKIFQEIKKHPLFYLFLVIILIASFAIRVYRINDLLGFYYDQGRDAIVIWDFINNHKFFLIGPTTGLAGIFRGPYYYYLIAPFYLFGRGNPVYPAIFLVLTSVFSVALLYYLGAKIQGKTLGLIAAVIASFSFQIVNASKWLSNPTPMLFISLVLVWSMLKVAEGKKWGWPIISFSVGLSLFNFGSSGELFYIPAVIIFAIWQRKNLPDFKNLFLSIFLFTITFAPLVFFDYKHGHILANNFYQTFIAQKSFTTFNKSLFLDRTNFYYNAFTKLIFDYRGVLEKIIFGIIGVWFLINFSKYIKNKNLVILIVLLISPILGLYFYQGNEKVLYDYYLTGYYLIFILLFSVVLADIWRFKAGKLFIIYFFYLFLFSNLSMILPRLKNDPSNNVITFLDQRLAIDWIYKNAGDKEFNVDIYVPPVIPYAYDYLFQWLGTYKYHKFPDKNQVPLLYTLYEIDPPHPERLNAWLERQKAIGKIIKEEKFGNITVQERIRIK